MYARSVEKLPASRGWLYEVKMDGYRCLAGRGAKKATLWSRRANVFTTQFPRITRAFEKLDENTLIDGEIVAVDHGGAVDSEDALLRVVYDQAFRVEHRVPLVRYIESRTLRFKNT